MRLIILSLATCAVLALVIYQAKVSEFDPATTESSRPEPAVPAATAPNPRLSPAAVPDLAGPPANSNPTGDDAVPVHKGEGRPDHLDPTTFEHSDYAFYETNVLSELAGNGDVTAMQVLAMRFFTTELSEENLEKAKALMRDAAAYGARHYPFSTMAENTGFELELALLGRLQMPEDRLREALVETLSYGELAAMRGNADLKMNLSHKFTHQYGLSPSEDEVAEIRQRAEARYAELEARRAELGLGSFDELPDEQPGQSITF